MYPAEQTKGGLLKEIKECFKIKVDDRNEATLSDPCAREKTIFSHEIAIYNLLP
jgi:hypothetical protein